jgi:UDP-N-acetylmuramate dehydrogenase
MKLLSEIKSLSSAITISENKPLSECTSFRLGGLCPLFIDNPSAEVFPEIIRLLNKSRMPFLVIGQGSNLVVSDSGLDCAVIRFLSETPLIQSDKNRVTVSGNTLLESLARFTSENAVGDLSTCSGIPGTVGGGIAGNAGAFGRQIGDCLVSAEILCPDGHVQTVNHEELDFSYRHSRLKETGEIILAAVFELPAANREILQAERKRILEFRRVHHPDWHAIPCAGSIFRNIGSTSAAERRKSAGYFLEEAGARKLSVGGARIYEKHANIIIADKSCTAQDVWELSKQMIHAVKVKFDIELTREVQFLGKFEKNESGEL